MQSILDESLYSIEPQLIKSNQTILFQQKSKSVHNKCWNVLVEIWSHKGNVLVEIWSPKGRLNNKRYTRVQFRE